MAVDIPVGIDLGTTYSVVSVFRGDQPEIIHSDIGTHTTPSWVAFTDKEIIVGDAAKDKAVMNPDNVIYGKKFLLQVYLRVF